MSKIERYLFIQLIFLFEKREKQSRTFFIVQAKIFKTMLRNAY